MWAIIMKDIASLKRKNSKLDPKSLYLDDRYQSDSKVYKQKQGRS